VQNVAITNSGVVRRRRRNQNG